MKIKRLIAFALSVVICLLSFTPAYAVIPTGRAEHTVRILSGEGKILKNKDETFNGQQIALDSMDDFEEVDYVEYEVVDGETLKNMLDYSNCDGSIYTAEMDEDTLVAKLDEDESLLPKWREVAFVTSTRIVKHICSLMNTSGLATAQAYTDANQYMPTGTKQMLLFVPSVEGKSFLHFVDQNGEVFKLSTPITSDTILTPIYTEEYVKDTLDATDEQFHQVTFLAGDGRIGVYKKRLDLSWSALKSYNEIDSYTEVVVDNASVLDERYITNSYLSFQNHDLFVSYNLLKRLENEFVESLNEHNIVTARRALAQMIVEADSFIFTSPYYYQEFNISHNLILALNDTENFDFSNINNFYESIRPYAISLFSFLSEISITDETLSVLLEDTLNDVEAAFENWSNYSDAEKAEFFERCIEKINKFSERAENYVNAYYASFDGDEYNEFRPAYVRNGYLYDEEDDWYGKENQKFGFQELFFNNGWDVDTDRYFAGSAFTSPNPFQSNIIFIPPSSSYKFSHFEDQYGNEYHLSDKITEDLYITPVFVEDALTTEINIVTEDNSNELFDVDVVREYETSFDEHFNAEQYDGTLIDYLNDKSSYHFDESDWEINSDGMIINYTGDKYNMLGIPSEINGVTVIGVSTYAFKNLYEDNYTSNFLDEYMAIYIPETVVNFTNGILEDKVKFFRNGCIGFDSYSDEELRNIELTVDGIDDCSPLIYLPNAYVSVSKDNDAYASIGGALYDKNITRLYYISSVAMERPSDSMQYYYSVQNEDGIYDERGGFVPYEGYEIPSSVTSVSAFFLKRISEYRNLATSIHMYGNTIFDTFSVMPSVINEVTQNYGSEFMYLNILVPFSSLGYGYGVPFGVIYIDDKETVKSLRESTMDDFLAFYNKIFELQGQPISDEELEFFTLVYGAVVNILFVWDKDFNGLVNRKGTVSQQQSLSLKHRTYDDYVYSVSLKNVPERYKKPKIEELNPSDISKQSATIYLELKKGSVDIITKDIDEPNLFLSATYEIRDIDNNVVSELFTLNDGSVAIKENLPYGDYYAIQTSIQESGYIRNKDIQSFSIKEDGEQIHLTFYNKYNPTIYSVKIPKTVVLNGVTGMAECNISVMGVLQDTQKITVEPTVNTFTMNELFATTDKKSPVTAIVNLQKREWFASDLQPDLWAATQFNISAPLTAGIWYGALTIRISIGDI